MDSDTITVSRAEWERLRRLEAELPAMLEKAQEEGGMNRLKILNQQRKENPEEHRRKSKERYELKKDQILAKRREAYRLKKEAAKTSQTPGVSSDRPEKSPAPQ